MSTLVSVGTCFQSFHRLLDEVARLAAARLLPEPVVVQHGHTKFSSPHCTAIGFVDRAEYERLVNASELIIAQAGAGSIVEALRAGRVPVIMPRCAARGEHVDDHQFELARQLGHAGRVVVAPEPEDLLGAVRRALERQARGRESARPEPALVGLVRETLRGWEKTAR
jgi:UDP-N-acetylglucosamine transferase subunit ALG13